MTKKLILSLFAALFLLVAAPVGAYYYPTEGDLIKTPKNSAVYYVDANGRRHLFSTEATFFSWYTGSWKDQNIKVISEYELNQLPSDKNVTVRPGFSLVHFDNSLRMYAVLPGGQLCRAPAHYGNYQYNRALTLPSSFEADYINDGICDITSDKNLPNGTLLRYTNSLDVYYIQNGQRRKLTDVGFSANKFRYESVITDVSWSMSYPDGANISQREDALVKVFANITSCTPNWTCGTFSACSTAGPYSGSYRYRSCWDSNNCGTTYNKPAEQESCPTCAENWVCSSWSSCAYNRQYRSCWDSNACGTTYTKPIESQTCNSCVENWTCGSWGSCQGTGSTGWQYRSCTDNNHCGTYNSQPTTSQTCRLCTENWSCTSWSVCSSGQQYRSCLDINRCNTYNSQPILTQSCR